MTKLPDFIQLKSCESRNLSLVFTAASDDLIELIAKCLTLDPLKRWNTTEALKSIYFQSIPYACDDNELPMSGSMQRSKRRLLREKSGEPPISRKRLF